MTRGPSLAQTAGATWCALLIQTALTTMARHPAWIEVNYEIITAPVAEVDATGRSIELLSPGQFQGARTGGWFSTGWG